MSHTFPAGHTVTRDDDHVSSPTPHGVNGLSGQTSFTTLVLVLQARQAQLSSNKIVLYAPLTMILSPADNFV